MPSPVNWLENTCSSGAEWAGERRGAYGVSGCSTEARAGQAVDGESPYAYGMDAHGGVLGVGESGETRVRIRSSRTGAGRNKNKQELVSLKNRQATEGKSEAAAATPPEAAPAAAPPRSEAAPKAAPPLPGSQPPVPPPRDAPQPDTPKTATGELAALSELVHEMRQQNSELADQMRSQMAELRLRVDKLDGAGNPRYVPLPARRPGGSSSRNGSMASEEKGAACSESS